MGSAFIDYVLELFGPFGTVDARRMFGGYGIYLDGLMFAIVSDDLVFLKADKMNQREFEDAGCARFTYARKGRPAALNFYQAPAPAMEAPQFMLPWARTAYAAALRANASKLAAAQARARKQAGAAAAVAPTKRVAARPGKARRTRATPAVARRKRG